jgi:hypothetical protein
MRFDIYAIAFLAVLFVTGAVPCKSLAQKPGGHVSRNLKKKSSGNLKKHNNNTVSGKAVSKKFRNSGHGKSDGSNLEPSSETGLKNNGGDTFSASSAEEIDDSATPAAEGNTVEGGSLKRSGRMEFDERLIKGEAAKSGAVYLFKRVPRRLPGLVPFRRSYRRRIVEPVLGARELKPVTVSGVKKIKEIKTETEQKSSEKQADDSEKRPPEEKDKADTKKHKAAEDVSDKLKIKSRQKKNKSRMKKGGHK